MFDSVIRLHGCVCAWKCALVKPNSILIPAIGTLSPAGIIRAQARKAQGPIVFLKILFINFFDYPGIFGGLNMVKNS